MAQVANEGLDRRLPTFVVVPTEARTLRARDLIIGPLLVIVRLDTSVIEIHYDSAWFDQTEARAFGDHLNVVLRAMAEAPQSAVVNLPVLTEQERHQLLDAWNDTAVPFAENTHIHEFFEAQVARTPEAVAVVFRDQQWTYRELDSQAEILARRLKSAGVRPGAYVAICLSRSLELMAALLAVFKAGAAYLPLDPGYPAERLAFMIHDAKPAAIVVSKQTEALFHLPGQHLVRVDAAAREPAPSEPAATGGIARRETEESDPRSEIAGYQAAYLLYTSGSTGKPKGVIVTHRNVSNFFTAMDAVIGTEPGVWLAVTSVNFDISVFELFWTLARGFRIILLEEGQWASQTGSKYSLPEQMKRHSVTHLQCTASLASTLIGDPESVAAIRQLRRFMVGGEPLPMDLAHRLSEIIAGDLFNLYGPTETTVWSTAQHIRRQDKPILIGRPVANTRVYVMDGERELVPIGSVGELYIGGEGLAKEYLNRPDVTQERFVTHSFSSTRTERLYRTGDLVRYTRDGRLECMGRIDQQIKIRGIRIEQGEIEVVLREHPDIRDAAVVFQQGEGSDNRQRLVAYVTASSAQHPSVQQLQQWLRTKLPQVMVPSVMVFLNELPKTPNGKLDRRALPKLERDTSEQETSQAVEGASTALERQIAAIWCETLGVPSVGLEERFFDIGGHSLLMVAVHDRLHDKTGHDVPLLDLFQYTTVRSLARYLSEGPTEVTTASTAASAALERGRLRRQLAAQHLALRRNGASKRLS
jgi:amino acid adenylation domain-containing protein